MAYISAIDDEEDKQPVPGVVPPVAGQASAPGPVAQQQPQQSRFVNFSRYLDANRSGAQSTAQKISGDISKQGQQVGSDLSNAQQQFGQAVQSGSQAYTAGRSMDDVRAGAAKGYSGPNALADNADWTQQQERARRAQDSANATASTGGLGAVLQEQNRGAYSGGNRRLDTALTGHVGADQFADARAKYGSMSDALNKANEASAKTADAARAATADAQGKYSAELKTREARAAEVKQAADAQKLLADVNALIDARTADLPNPQHKSERVDYLTKSGQLQKEIEARYGPGAWDRYVAAKQQANDARSAAIKASYSNQFGGL